MVSSDNRDFDILEGPALDIVLLLALVFVFGAVLSALDRFLDSRLPRADRAGPVVVYGLVTAVGLIFVPLGLLFQFMPGFDERAYAPMCVVLWASGGVASTSNRSCPGRPSVTRHDSDLEEIWRDALTNPDSPFYRYGRIRKHFTGNPRCKLCKLPLGGMSYTDPQAVRTGAIKRQPPLLQRLRGLGEDHPGGAEIELTLLFADVRGSTRLPRT